MIGSRLFRTSRAWVCCVLVLLCLGLVFASALADDAWTCPECGEASTGRFCPNCGAPKPLDGSGDTQLKLSIDFRKNVMFSTYDVDVFVDDTRLGTMRHGTPMARALFVEKGRHTISFYKHNDITVNGALTVDVTGDTDLHFRIHARRDEITFENVKTYSFAGGSAQSASGGTASAIAFKQGERAEIDGIAATLLSVREIDASSGAPDDGTVYVLCEFEMENLSGKRITISATSDFDAYCDDYKVEQSLLASTTAKHALNGAIEPGKKLKGEMVFELPSNWKKLEILFAPKFWSNNNVTFVAER